MMVYPDQFFVCCTVFLRPGPSVHEKLQAPVGHVVAQWTKSASPVVVVLAGQIPHETGFAFGTYQAFVFDYLMRGVLYLNNLLAWSTRGWYITQG
jgi:hypothetical protein